MGCFPSHGTVPEGDTKTPAGATPGASTQTETPSAIAAASTTATVPLPMMPPTETAQTDHRLPDDSEASAATLPGLGLVNVLSPTVARILSISAPLPTDTVIGNPIQRGGEEALHHLRNIFAAPISFARGAAGFRMPHFPKSDLETTFLRNALRNHYLFESQPESSVTKLIAAFEMCTLTAADPRAQPAPGQPDQFLVPFLHQGEEVTPETAYFYVLYHGRCQFLVDDALVGWAAPGDSFGELALLYDGPRAATVTAVLERAGPKKEAPVFPDHTVVLFRVHQRSFRLILQQDDQDADNAKMKLLDGIDFLTHVSPQVKAHLAAVMTPFPFNKGDVIVQKGAMDLPWTVIERGTVRAANLDMGYQDFTLRPGECFGERAIVKGDPAIGDAIAESPGVAFTVDQETFRALVGNLDDVILRAQDVVKLKAIAILSDATHGNDRVLGYLSRLLVDHPFAAGEVICQEGQPLKHPAALYLVRNGSVRIESSAEPSRIVEVDGFLGEDQLKADTQKATYKSPYTAIVVEPCTCGVLKLRDCRNVLNTRRMGEGNVTKDFDSLALSGSVDGAITMKELRVHRMIGAGTFGQVHLVSRVASDGTERPYALKVQSKFELCQSGQAKGVVREKNLMALFHSPFVARLIAAFQDEKCVYMLMNLLQGGELYSVMHTATTNVLSEEHAKFYSACVAEALFYLHCSHSLVFRDLKPENVMIDEKGYAILIDFGFCKKISGKTYTTCGTPLYLAPEVILNRGHSWSVDHWSLGVMIYEMLVGSTPFYKHGMSKADLFRNIVQGKVYPPADASPEALSLLSGLLRRDPAKRLGSLGGSEVDIIEHPWFQNIDRDQLFMKEVKPPFIPQIKDPFDSSNFSDDWKHVEDKRRARYPKLNAEDAAIFDAF
jgi:protein kinase A